MQHSVGTQFTNGGNVAPSFLQVANLVESMRIEMGGRTVSNVANDLGVVSNVFYRTNNSGAWLRTVGGQTSLTDANYYKRHSYITSDGKKWIGAPNDTGTIDTSGATANKSTLGLTESTGAKNQYEVIFVPPLGLMNYKGALPAGSYSLVCRSKGANDYQQSMVESKDASSLSQANLAQCLVKSCEFYTFQMQGPRMDEGSYILDLTELRAQGQKVDGKSLHSLQYTISPSTTSIIVGYQDNRTTSDTRIP